ncbi:MAG TPA: hypothetical protein VHG91_18755 [Longimicrobium sp.]|nr:hypothetical protein [Longimicrobium sp.]
MRRNYVLAAAGSLALLALLAAVRPAGAQEWTPPSRQMPEMPTTQQLSADGAGAAGAWARGVQVSQARGEGAGGGGRVKFVRFLAGVRPAITWSDRNGDGRADMIEVYRNGALAYQLVDADYDGTANVLRVYDAGGALAREERM